MFCCWRTATRCPGDGLTGWLPIRISPSTTLPFDAAPASARRKSRSNPRTLSPSMPSPNGISDSSIDVGITMSKPATLAPPSSVADSTRPISPVQVSIGAPLNGAVRRLSSSIAMTTAGEAAGSCLWPNSSQRRAVRISRDSPRIGLATGETEAAAQTSAMAATIILLRVLRLILKRDGPSRLFHPQQPADDRRRAGLGLRIHPEHDLRRLERSGVEAAGNQGYILAGEIEEASLELGAAQINLLTLARHVEAPDHQLAAAFGFHQRRCAVKDELRLRQ